MKKIFLTIILLSLSTIIFASPSLSQLFSHFDEKTLNYLKEGNTLERATCDGQSISNIAPSSSQGYALAIENENLEDGFSIASLSFIPYPERFEKMSEEEKNIELYNILRSISTQKGIKYISHMAGDKPVVLFEDSYLISDPSDKNSRIDDPISTTVPASFSCYSYQKDNRFGKNVYSLDYKIQGSDFLMTISNYNTMKYMGFSCVEKNSLSMYLEVLQAEEGFVIYSMATVKDREPKVKILFLTVDLPSAFMRRITALKDWFSIQVNK